MKFLPALLSLTVVLSSVTACSNYNKQAEAYDQQNSSTNEKGMKVEHFTLDNGLNVYLTKNNQTPRFRAEIAVKTGSKRDPA
ncbi:MAG: hypothetical protein H7263_10210, partial [Candidatus Sericytochromatia bacterium]|nr:hypothetical protein [Candidatus Sericytochromatia bacterium]